MLHRHRLAALAAGLSLAALGSGFTQAQNEQDAQTLAVQATAQGLTGQERIDFLISNMTIEEKLGQLHQMAGGRQKNLNSRLDDGEFDRVRQGKVGSYLHVAGAGPLEELQRTAVEESRTGIPLLFAMDVIHGYRTIYPVPLALAASFSDEVGQSTARIAAEEASAAGLHWTFAPMIDIARDPRWGRIVEGAGEEPYLSARMAAAQVRGYQGRDLTAPDTIIATAKHFGAYGAGEGGRDYNSADISERTLHETYLPPFHAATVEAGAGSVMVAFNDIGGVPATANAPLLQDVLRKAWSYDGLVVSDWNAVLELTNHGVAADRVGAGTLALEAGVDMEMTSGIYAQDLAEAVRGDETLQASLDDAVGHVLLAKDRLGLFDDPYAYHDTDREAAVMLSEEHRAVARDAAVKSMVLLKNENQTLPIREGAGRVALIGALADDPYSPLGSWSAQGSSGDVVTIRAGLEAALPEGVRIDYVPGADARSMPDRRDLRDAVRAAERADVAVLVIGEDWNYSGEARSRSDITLPAGQAALAEAILATDTPVVVVLMNGRPLDISSLDAEADAILETWFLGVETGPAVASVLFGEESPGGRLPASFPRRTGQVPIFMGHYPTGRPADPDLENDSSRYTDVDITPLYPFGHGLSYASFDYAGISQDTQTVGAGGTITISADVTNAGEMAADEVVQLYTRDPLATVARPVQELRGFSRVSLDPGETKTVSFKLRPEQFAYWGQEGAWRVDAGEIRWMIGSTSADIRGEGSFTIEEGVTADEPAAAIETVTTVSGGNAESEPVSVGSIDRLDPRADEVIPENAAIEKLTDDTFGWSEGPVWMPDRSEVLFSDVPGNTLYGWSEEGGLEVVLQPSGLAGEVPPAFREPGSNGLIADGPNAILMGDHGNRAIARVDLGTKERTFLAQQFEGKRFSSPNDLVRAEDGTIYFTDPPYGLQDGDESELKELDFNGVYRLSPDGTVSLIDRELTRPNGVGLSPDERTLYVAVSDPDAARLYAYDVGEDGDVTNRRVLIDLTAMVKAGEPGLPDGMAVSQSGNIWLAGPGGIHLLSPEGERLALVRTGTAAANVALTDTEDAIYITSGSFLARVKLGG
ncbi:beta-glucosidase BglX [Parvularcula dongshanensis]|uniref:Beta-D-glucoside glucohydrolase n=1 Tax=Parvularcula dongshanensis TaxID=1173995 RepID=A0A840I6Q7_9PROT|nr:beta-glucosidase BglX [Parvularcula dongshanensis]MBB4659941.1 beta-glucosidase [Parvularcula dongshanensis]